MEGQQQRERLGIPVDGGKKILLVNESQDIKKATEVVPAEIFDEMNRSPVDAFLVEALQDPRHRLTILRLEKEIQKFHSNPKVQQLEFLPMPSSYVRLAAHRVAQHYHMKTTVIENRVIVFKTADSRQQVPRLADMYTEVAEVKLQPKVAIKRRPKSEGDKKSLKQDSGKSVEERSEDYNKARARIFSEEIGEDSVRVCCHIEVVRVDSSSSRLEDSSTTEVNETIQAPGVKTCSKSDKENMSRSRDSCHSKVKNSTSNSSGSSTATTNRVAIFRDREKDSRDPDYDRSYDRYLQRRDVSMPPMFSMQFEQPAWIPHPRYEPQAAMFLMQAQQTMYPGPYAPQVPRLFQPPRFQPSQQPASYIHSRH